MTKHNQGKSMNQELFRHTEKLYYFYEASLLGSFQATARKLNTTASTLSYAVKQLEDVIGSALFTRSRNGLAMTNIGSDLQALCKKFFHELDDLYVAAASKHRQPQRLRLGTFASIAIYFVPLLYRELNHAGCVSLSIKTSRSADILEKLLNRDIHLALTVETCKHPDVIAHQLYQDEYALYAALEPYQLTQSKDDWLRQQSIFFIPDASDKRGITLARHVHSWDYGFQNYGELDSLEVVAKFVRKGLGLGILPTHVANLYHDQMTVVHLPHTPARFGQHRFFLSYRRDLELNHSLVKHVLHLAQKVASDLAFSTEQH